MADTLPWQHGKIYGVDLSQLLKRRSFKTIKISKK